MSTRSGDVDPGALAYLAEKRGLSLPDVEALLQTQSGLLGLSGRTGDLKTLLEEAARGDETAERADTLNRAIAEARARDASLGPVDYTDDSEST